MWKLITVFGSDETDPYPEPKKSTHTHTLLHTTSWCFTSLHYAWVYQAIHVIQKW